MKNPKISVALCTYNGARYLEQQLRSILNQSYSPYEMIISDDGSTDNTVGLVESICREASFPVRIFLNKSNKGIKENFEKAIDACSGDYIALADQDDIWMPEKLSIFSDTILKSDRSVPVLFYSDLSLIDAEGHTLAGSFLTNARITPPQELCWKFLATRNFAPGCCIVFDSRLVKHILPIPPQSILHDWWINLVFSLWGSIQQVNADTISYRLHSGNNQGIPNLSRLSSVGRESGFFSIATSNLVAGINQIKCVVTRLRENDEPCPPELGELITLFEISRLARPISLIRLGIRRGNFFKTCTMLVASVFVSVDLAQDDTVTFV